MLTILVYVGNREIDRIEIYRTRSKPINGLNKYKFKFPVFLKDKEILHDKHYNWTFLMEKALKIYNDELRKQNNILKNEDYFLERLYIAALNEDNKDEKNIT